MGKKMSLEDVIKLTGLSASKLYKATHKREIRFYKVFGKIVFDEDIILEWIEANTVNIRSKEELEKEAAGVNLSDYRGRHG